ncbi:MAG: hypothetical protein R3F29_12655 [Planctomycetota bacterium]
MRGRRASPWSRVLRRLASPAMLVAVAGAVMLTGTLRETARVLRQAQVVHHAAADARAAIAAETALANSCDGVSWTQHEVAGVQVSVRGDAGGYRVRCEFEGVVRDYAAQWLPGGAPAALGWLRSSPDPAALERFGGGHVSDLRSLPRLDGKLLEGAAAATQLGGVHRDPGIALSWFARGTDRDDYVWRSSSTDQALATHRAGLAVVAGHLWIEPGDVPLTVALDEDLVVVVYGNVYLGRSLAVRGPGRLLLVAAEVADVATFADEDGSGHWSRGDRLLTGSRFGGPVEGAGAVYLGMPGAPRAAITCAAGLVVAGQMHVSTDAEVDGPLCLAHGITDLGVTGRPWRLGGGEWTFRPGRERVPGFVTSGAPRPGLLQSILQQPLYPKQGAR